MTRSYSPEQHYLVFETWPTQDQTVWAKLTEPGPTILDDRGAFADSRPRTNVARQKNYSHWLNHIMLNHPGLLPLMPAARIRPETLAGWLAILNRTVAPYTRMRRVVDLLAIARAVDPSADWGFLQRAVYALTVRAVPSRNKEPRIRPSATLVELGFAMMRKTATLPAGRARAATLHRDGLLIALLALRPLRLRNFAGLELGQSLHQTPVGWYITIPADETKTHRTIEAGWPTDLVEALTTYLELHRPVLLHGRSTNALWIGSSGQALAAHTIRQTVIHRTLVAFGVPINPHLFRDCAATTLATEDPAHVGAATAILGHGSDRTAHKHYIHANTLMASRRHQDALAARRRGSKTRRP
jgi:integrase